jgi:hypothetical protein
MEESRRVGANAANQQGIPRLEEVTRLGHVLKSLPQRASVAHVPTPAANPTRIQGPDLGQLKQSLPSLRGGGGGKCNAQAPLEVVAPHHDHRRSSAREWRTGSDGAGTSSTRRLRSRQRTCGWPHSGIAGPTPSAQAPPRPPSAATNTAHECASVTELRLGARRTWRQMSTLSPFSPLRLPP